jgi:hypothetical protein
MVSSEAAVGHPNFTQQLYGLESLVGPLLALKNRADLLEKIRVRLGSVFGRTLTLEWHTSGLRPRFHQRQRTYDANTEASGFLHLVSLLAAIHDPEVSALLIDEPEVSLHPQLQEFLLQEMLSVAGDPVAQLGKKLVVIATHCEHMVPLRKPEDITSIKFINSLNEPPTEVSPDAPQLKWKDLPDQLRGLQRFYRAALFGQTILLVEGQSDDIIVNSLAQRLNLPLAGTGVQVLAATGKDTMPNLYKLFRLLGKRVVVVADLDGVIDGNSLYNLVADNDTICEETNQKGHGSLQEFARSLRTDFNKAVEALAAELRALEVVGHPSFQWFDESTVDEKIRFRRAAAWLTLNGSFGNDVPASLRTLAFDFGARVRAFLDTIEKGGLFVLRRGAIECYYTNSMTVRGKSRKSSLALAEVESWSAQNDIDLRNRYDDLVRGLEFAAPRWQVDENRALREVIGAALGAVLPNLTRAATDDEINGILRGRDLVATGLIRLSNASREDRLAVVVEITSSLFARATFPAEFSQTDNLSQRLKVLLP